MFLARRPYQRYFRGESLESVGGEVVGVTDIGVDIHVRTEDHLDYNICFIMPLDASCTLPCSYRHHQPKCIYFWKVLFSPLPKFSWTVLPILPSVVNCLPIAPWASKGPPIFCPIWPMAPSAVGFISSCAIVVCRGTKRTVELLADCALCVEDGCAGAGCLFASGLASGDRVLVDAGGSKFVVSQGSRGALVHGLC